MKYNLSVEAIKWSLVVGLLLVQVCEGASGDAQKEVDSILEQENEPLEMGTNSSTVEEGNEDSLDAKTNLDCGNWDDDTQAKVHSCSFWMEGVILTGTGMIGLIGNILSIVILSKPDMYNSFNQLLITLSTMDSVFIILAIVDYSFNRAFKWSSETFIYTFPFIIYPLNNISFCASIFTTVALAYERHSAVCKPIHYRNVTAKYTVRRRTLCYVIPVLILSVILNIPKFMETKFTWTPLNSGAISSNSSANSSGDQEIEYAIGLGVSDLREDPDYIRFYINWTRLITTGLIPMGALIYFNFGIFRGIQMTHERVKKKNKQRASEMNLAAILLCIVFLFLVCHFPRILLNVHELFMLENMIVCGVDFTPPVWFFCFTSFNHWLLIVNASCNFLIYVSVGDKFKTTIGNFFKSKLGCCYPTNQESPGENKPLPLTLITRTTTSPGAVTTSVAVGNSQAQSNKVETVVEMNPQKRDEAKTEEEKQNISVDKSSHSSSD